MRTHPNILIIGYGNPSRRDDRVGWYIIENLEKMTPPQVRMEKLHQLEIEWVDVIKDYDWVLFVDAHMSESDNWKQKIPITPGYEITAITHHLTPSNLLGLCSVLHQRTPSGILYSVKGIDFNFGEELSPNTKRAADETIQEILEFIGRIVVNNSHTKPVSIQ